MKKLEKRMYSLVLYQLSGIQAGIQAYHATIEYSIKHNSKDYVDWCKNWKTVVILNGGTSNSNNESYYELEPFEGTMEQNLKKLNDIGIKASAFHEPDLNYAMTAISFLVDERCFSKQSIYNFDFEGYFKTPVFTIEDYYAIKDELMDNKYFKDYLKMMGGEKNVLLRIFLKNFKLASN